MQQSCPFMFAILKINVLYIYAIFFFFLQIIFIKHDLYLIS